MSTKKDERNIVFKNKQEIRSFEKRISRALSAKDGTSDLIIYKTYKIRLLTEMGGVFMIVNEAGQSQSTLRISKEMYSQVNIVMILVSFLMKEEKPLYKFYHIWDGLYERPFRNHSSDHGSPSKTKGFFLQASEHLDL